MFQSDCIIRKAVSGHAKAPLILENGKIYDVLERRYHANGSVLVIKEGTVASIEKANHEGGEPVGRQYSDERAIRIDLGGRFVYPALFNTHCHLSMGSPIFFPTLKGAFFDKRHYQTQIDANMSECLARGITNVREAYIEDMRIISELKRRIERGLLPGPRIMQSVVVGPTGSYMAEKYSFTAKLMAAVLGGGPSDHNQDYAGVLEFAVDATEEEVRACVDEAIDVRGAQAIKIGD